MCLERIIAKKNIVQKYLKLLDFSQEIFWNILTDIVLIWKRACILIDWSIKIMKGVVELIIF